MSIRRFSTSSLTTGSKSSKFWDQETLPGAFESIASAVVDASGSNSISFTNIPQNFKHLQLRVFAKDSRNTDASQLSVQYNSDAGTNYTSHALYGNGSSISVVADGTSQTSAAMCRIAGNTDTTNIYAAGIVDILDYSSSLKYKTTKALAGYDINGNGQLYLTSGLWMSTAAITRMDITPVTTPIRQYSSFALYGIRGA
jgi:hypothetical protein